MHLAHLSCRHIKPRCEDTARREFVASFEVVEEAGQEQEEEEEEREREREREREIY